MAEREGFEPPIPVKVCPLSRRIVSTTHAPLRCQAIVSWLSAGVRLHSTTEPTTNDTSSACLKNSCNISPQRPASTPAANLHSVIQAGMIQHLHHRMNGTRLGIIRAVNQPFQAGVHDCSGAHGARLNCNKQFAVAQTMISEAAPASRSAMISAWAVGSDR